MPDFLFNRQEDPADADNFPLGAGAIAPSAETYKVGGALDLTQGAGALAAAADVATAAPTGVMVFWGGAAAPAGWLLCDGGAVPATTPNATLRALLTAWGLGTNTPDLRGRFPFGKTAAGTGSTLFGTGGAAAVDSTHTHSVDPASVASGPALGGEVLPGAAGVGAVPTTHTHDVNIPATTSSATAAAPPWMAINFIIKI